MVKGKVEAPEAVTLEGAETDETNEATPAGIPEFWLGVLQANEVVSSRVQDSARSVARSRKRALKIVAILACAGHGNTPKANFTSGNE